MNNTPRPLPAAKHADPSKGHKEPANTKMWAMLTAQARGKFQKFPSPAASQWVHKKYVEMGGRFRDTRNEDSKGHAVKGKKKKK